MGNNIHLITGAGFILICLLFFLPFVNIQCSGTKIMTVTGLELVTGFQMNSPSMSGRHNSAERSDANVFAIAALGFSLVGAILAFVSRKKIVNLTFAALTAAALLALQIDLGSKTSSRARDIAITLNFEFAYWLALIVSIALIVLAIVIKPQNSPADVLKE